MALSSSRPRHLLRPLLRGLHATAQALARPEPHEFSNPSEHLGSWGEPAGDPREAWARLENWREKEKLKADKRAEDRELLGRKSSVWIADNELENRILKAIKFTTPL
ncbi:Os12g0146400 [Oryza sativa Japonica Group]|uniref:Os12g0146400 protein n=2 Tax=Oryza sativa subsp. japonica TaxID=39947 RepID=C7J9F9_ORYSJ|nr:hypothetical protein EE612_057770 [Oryza sativa]BAH95521.1 Os12g0146300 [Oryza sativa Japonica Group]BAT15885.1 Os12g0146400 [Oryza sativa Japonica Group]|eukprot:NP_001176793.1 Os12g0146300 [Oryza sativa Japonica Group]